MRESFTIVHAHSPALGAEPEIAMAVLQDGPDIKITQALFFGKRCNGFSIKPVHSSTPGPDPDIALAILKQESDFGRYVVSKAGALGDAQFIESTGRRYGLRAQEPIGTHPENGLPMAGL